MKNTSQLPDPSTSMATGSFFNAWVAGQAVRVSLDRAAQSLDKEYLQAKISNPSAYTDALGITYGLCRNFKGDVLISGGNLVVNSNTGYFENIQISHGTPCPQLARLSFRHKAFRRAGGYSAVRF